MKRALLAISILFLQTSFITKDWHQKRAFKRLLALEGKWETKTWNKKQFVEEWKILNENRLEGRKFQIENGDTTQNLTLLLQRTIQGIVFSLKFEPQDSLVYIYKTRRKNEFQFENYDAEYKRTLSYWLVTPDSLLVDRRFDGGKGKTNFYRRVKS